jgi:hypothetical protein
MRVIPINNLKRSWTQACFSPLELHTSAILFVTGYVWKHGGLNRNNAYA